MRNLLIADNWQDYEILDTGDGMKLERWKDVVLARPDPQVIWSKSAPELWLTADALYQRSSKGGGHWEYNSKLPDKWKIKYGEMEFYVEPTGFKHTGIFPEQAPNWDWMAELISARKAATGESPRILNLFGYTGGATVACAMAGAEVTHVDAAKGMVTRCRENVELSGLGQNGRHGTAVVRYIVDDAFKFVSRQVRKGSRYDGIIMDPPSYGRGPGGEVWKLEDSLYSFVEETANLISDTPLFFLLNSYTTGLSPVVTSNILALTVAKGREGKVTAGDLCLPVSSNRKVLLPCGSYARFEAT